MHLAVVMSNQIVSIIVFNNIAPRFVTGTNDKWTFAYKVKFVAPLSLEYVMLLSLINI